MKEIIITLCALLVCTISHAQTETMNWYVGGDIYATTTCESGADVILPIAPTKRGYTFEGWGSQYTRLEYIESTGAQFINLGTPFSSDDTIEIDVSWTNMFDGTTVFGSKEYNQWTFGRYLGITYYGGNYISKVFYSRAETEPENSAAGTMPTLVEPIKIGTIYKIIWQPTSGKIRFNNSTYENSNYPSQTSNLFTTANNPFLFATNQAGTAAQYDYARIYGFKRYDSSDTLLLDLVPALDWYGVACMLDRVSGTFFYNQGSGNFVAGPIMIEED